MRARVQDGRRRAEELLAKVKDEGFQRRLGLLVKGFKEFDEYWLAEAIEEARSADQERRWLDSLAILIWTEEQQLELIENEPSVRQIRG